MKTEEEILRDYDLLAQFKKLQTLENEVKSSTQLNRITRSLDILDKEQSIDLGALKQAALTIIEERQLTIRKQLNLKQ